MVLETCKMVAGGLVLRCFDGRLPDSVAGGLVTYFNGYLKACKCTCLSVDCMFTPCSLFLKHFYGTCDGHNI